jgi:diguanylate cyclase (GGDEF)-like protein
MRKLFAALSGAVLPINYQHRSYWRDGALGLIVSVFVVLLGTEAWELWRLYQTNIEETATVTATTARSLAEQADLTVKTADSIVASLVERVEAEGTGPEARTRFYHLMTSLAAALPAIHEIGIMNERGDAIVKSLVQNPTGINYKERKYFQRHAANPDRGPIVGSPIKSKIDGRSAITVSRRINYPDGSFAGVVVASVSMKFFQQLFDQMQAKSGGVIALLADDGTVLARSPGISSETPVSIADSELLQKMRNRPLTGTVSYQGVFDGVRRYGSYQRLQGFPLVTLVSQSLWDIERTFRAQLLWNAITSVCITVVLVIMGARTLKANRLLNTRAMQDGLTGLANRRTFDEAIEREFRGAEWSRVPISVIMIDIDHFKDYNDLYGHPAGDECLRAVAQTIQGCVRRASDLVARYGGEEVAVILPGLDRQRALALSEGMRVAIHKLALPHARNVHGVVTFSAGIATYVPGSSVGGWQTLIERADAALYAAKASGRDALRQWSPPVISFESADGVEGTHLSAA